MEGRRREGRGIRLRLHPGRDPRRRGDPPLSHPRAGQSPHRYRRLPPGPVQLLVLPLVLAAWSRGRLRFHGRPDRDERVRPPEGYVRELAVREAVAVLLLREGAA